MKFGLTPLLLSFGKAMLSAFKRTFTTPLSSVTAPQRTRVALPLSLPERDWRHCWKDLTLALLLAMLLVVLIGCSSVPQTPPANPPPTGATLLPYPAPVNLESVDWIVIESPEGQRYVALTPEQFETLMANHAELLRYIREAGYQIRHYRGEN